METNSIVILSGLIGYVLGTILTSISMLLILKIFQGGEKDE